MSRSFAQICVGVLLFLVGVAALPLAAGEPVFRSLEATQRILLDQPMPPSGFPEMQLAIVTPAYSADGSAVNNVDCRAIQKRNGEVVGGNTIILDPEVIDLDSGNTLANPPGRTAAFKPFALKTFGLGDYSALFPSDEVPSLGILVDAALTGNVPIDEVRVTCGAKNRQPCRRDDETLCLAGNRRFQVRAEWSNGAVGGQAGVFRTGATGGEFFFFFADFPELAVQVLNGCKNNGHYWVFAAATTSVEYTMTVVDTQSGESRAYSNPLGRPAPAITDTAAFATCP